MRQTWCWLVWSCIASFVVGKKDADIISEASCGARLLHATAVCSRVANLLRRRTAPESANHGVRFLHSVMNERGRVDVH